MPSFVTFRDYQLHSGYARIGHTVIYTLRYFRFTLDQFKLKILHDFISCWINN